MRVLVALITRDLRLAVRLGGGGGMAVFFFLAAVTIVPLGVGPDLGLLSRIAPGILWVSLLLSALLTLDRVFQADFEDGSLDLLMLAPVPLEWVVFAKSVSHWLTSGLPLVLAALPLGFLLNLDGTAYPALLVALALGTPALSFIGAVGAALTVNVRRGGLLTSLLVLPFYIPVLIFGVSAVDGMLLAGADDFSARSLMLLGALNLASLVLGPIAAAAALRAHLG